MLNLSNISVFCSFFTGISITVFIVAFLVLLCKFIRTRKKFKKKKLEFEGYSEILATAPEGYFAWIYKNIERSETSKDDFFDVKARQKCSRRLAVSLGLLEGINSGFDQILERFETESRQRLLSLVEDLRRIGTGFDASFYLKHNSRVLNICGIRAQNIDGDVLADVIWAKDVTATSQELAGLTESLEQEQKETHFLKKVMDMLPIPIWARNANLEIFYCNKNYIKSVGAKDKSDVRARNLELAEGLDAKETRALASIAKRNQEQRTRKQHVVINGARKLLELFEIPLGEKDNIGNDIYTTGTALDITKQEELETELSSNIKAHQDVLENLETAIAIFGTDTRIKFYNKAFQNLWLLDEDWLSERPKYGEFLDLILEKRLLPETRDYSVYKSDELKLFETNEPNKNELLPRPDEKTLKRRVFPYPRGGLIFTYENVTDEMDLERSYNALYKSYKETLGSLYEAVAIFSTDGRMKHYNQSLLELWGLTKEFCDTQPHVKSVVDKFKPYFENMGDWSKNKESLLKHLRSDKKIKEVQITRNDGTVLDVNCVYLPDGSQLVTYIDVTEEAFRQKQLEKRGNVMLAVNRLRSRFITSVSQELNSPLDKILSFSELLSNEINGSLNNKQKEYATNILETAEDLQNIISNILDLAAIEIGKNTLKLDTFDVHYMLTNVLSLTKERAKRKNISINFECPIDIGWIAADENRIKQAFFYVISNALANAKDKIDIIAKKDFEKSVIIVTISGISATFDSDKTEVFKHGKTAITEKNNNDDKFSYGSNFGITLVKEFVEMHQGKIVNKTNDDNQNIVEIYLPTQN
jgi:signal transduction histidine kinase